MLEIFRNISRKRRERVAYLDWVEHCEDALAHWDEVNDQDWGFRSARRQIDQQRGEVTFVDAHQGVHRFRVHLAGALLLGRYADAGLWRWGWDISEFSQQLTRALLRVKAHGSTHRMERLATSGYPVTLIEAWGLTAVACRLCGARGAFVERTANGYLFFIFSDLAAPEVNALADANATPDAAPATTTTSRPALVIQGSR